MSSFWGAVQQALWSPTARVSQTPRQRSIETSETSFYSTHVSAQPTISIVIPTLNEEENLYHVLPRIPAWVHEVILVDGRSTDRTVQVARQLRPDIIIVEELRHGKGAALQAGFGAASGDIIVMLDADGSTDPSEMPLFISALLAGADFCKGSRFMQGGGTADMSFIRGLGNWGLTLFVRLLFGGRYSDLCYGYNAFWRRVLPQLNPDADGFEIETLLNVRAVRNGLKVAEVPSFEHARVHGESHLHALRDGLRVLATILREGLQPSSRALPLPAPISLGTLRRIK